MSVEVIDGIPGRLMLDGFELIDVHLHAAQLPTLKPRWDVWVQDFDRPDLRHLYGSYVATAGGPDGVSFAPLMLAVPDFTLSA
jgi:hypothetical protein